MRILLLALILGGIVAGVMTQLPDIERYLKMRSMARPQNPAH